MKPWLLVCFIAITTLGRPQETANTSFGIQRNNQLKPSIETTSSINMRMIVAARCS